MPGDTAGSALSSADAGTRARVGALRACQRCCSLVRATRSCYCTAIGGKACAPGHASGRSGAIGNAAEARSPRDPRPCRATPDAAKGAMSEPLATKTVALRGLWLRQQKPTGRHTDGTCAPRAVQPGKRRSYDRDPPLAHQQTGCGATQSSSATGITPRTRRAAPWPARGRAVWHARRTINSGAIASVQIASMSLLYIPATKTPLMNASTRISAASQL